MQIKILDTRSRKRACIILLKKFPCSLVIVPCIKVCPSENKKNLDGVEMMVDATNGQKMTDKSRNHSDSYMSPMSTRSKSQVSGKSDRRIVFGWEILPSLLLFIMMEGEISEGIAS